MLENSGEKRMPTAVADRTDTIDSSTIGKTRAAQPEGLMRQSLAAAKDKDAWNELIVGRLLAWEENAGDMEEDDLIPPTRVAVEVALVLARKWRDAGNPCPEDMVPDRDGGILFVRCEKMGNQELTINFHDDGSFDLLHFRGADLISRNHTPAMPL
jgi:hypothetical protein